MVEEREKASREVERAREAIRMKEAELEAIEVQRKKEVGWHRAGGRWRSEG